MSTENLLRFTFSNRSAVCLLLVSLLYTLAYPFLVREVLTIRPTKPSMDGDTGRQRRETTLPLWLIVRAHRAKLPALTSKKLILPVKRCVTAVVVGALITMLTLTDLLNVPFLLCSLRPQTLTLPCSVCILLIETTTGNTTCNPLKVEVCRTVWSRLCRTLP